MPAAPEHVLAIDLGASGLRAALIDPAGRFAHIEAVRLELADEADPALWRDALLTATDALAARADAVWDGVRAVCATGFTRTQVLLDANGAPVRPAITFRDTRAAALAAAHGLDAFHPKARLLWLAAHEPGSLGRARAVVDPKDYLGALLTGRVCTDTVCGARLAGSLPETAMLAPLDAIGKLRDGLPGALGRLAGAEMVMAAHDSWASVIGLGAMRPGAAYTLSVSTDVLGVLSDTPATAPGLLSDDWGGLWHLGGPSNAGGDSLAWLLGLLAPGEAPGPALDRLLAAPRAAAGRAIFLPYLTGERTPYWDAGLRGGFAGLHRSHGPADLAWAVMEGVACLNRIVLDRAEAASGRVAALHAGGGASVGAWRQVKADILQRPLLATAEPECGLLGAAAVAWTAIGRFPTLIAAQDSMVRIAARHEPGVEPPGLLRQFRAAEAALAPISHDLSGAAHA